MLVTAWKGVVKSQGSPVTPTAPFFLSFSWLTRTDSSAAEIIYFSRSLRSSLKWFVSLEGSKVKKRGKDIITAYPFEHRFGTTKRLKMRLVSFLSAVFTKSTVSLKDSGSNCLMPLLS